MRNGLALRYNLVESTFIFRGVGGNFDILRCKQNNENREEKNAIFRHSCYCQIKSVHPQTTDFLRFCVII